MRAPLAVFVAALTLAGAAAPAHAAAPAAERSLTGGGELIATYNRLGALLTLNLRFRQRLYQSESEAFGENYVGVTLLSQTSPSFSQNGAVLELAPAAFFAVSAGYQLVSYFGVFGSLQAYPDCSAPLETGDRETRCDFQYPITPLTHGESEAGHRAWANVRLRAKVGRLAVVESASLERWWFADDWDPGAQNSYWYNELHMTPQRRTDEVVVNALMVILDVVPERGPSDWNLMVGLSDRLAWARGTDYLMHRVGAMGVARLPMWNGMKDAAVVGILEWYTHDRYNGGRAVPFVAVMFAGSTPNLL